MALGRIKTEMHGDTSRWGPRAVIKHAADKLRREADKHAVTVEGAQQIEAAEDVAALDYDWIDDWTDTQ